jgi:Arf-GAP/GTPase/ANK repeat/PH domain-containing protein 1/3
LVALLLGLHILSSFHKDGRYKCKLPVDDQTRLVLIREETGMPSREFCSWLDVLMLVFSNHDESTLLAFTDISRNFLEERGQEPPILLVGTTVAGETGVARESTVVTETTLKKVTDKLEKAIFTEAVISDDAYNDDVFSHACQMALYAHTSPTTLSTMSRGFSLDNPPTPNKKFNPPAASPVQFRKNKRMSRFLSGGKGSYSVAKEKIGTGRDIPKKEGEVKKNGKKKYLVLGTSFLSYYPSHNDYCKNINEKGVCLDKIMIRDPSKKVSLAARSKEQLNSPTSGTTSPNPDAGYMGISPSSTENGDLSLFLNSALDQGVDSGSESGRSREGSSLNVDQMGVTGVNRKAGSVDLSHAKPNGKLVETPLTLQQFHERRKKLEGLNSIHFKSGSSSSLNVPMTSMSSSHVEIPRSSTLNADFPARRLIPVDETEPSIPAKKGSIRHTRGHRRGKSWGGSKGLDAELSGGVESLEFQIINSDGKSWVFEASSVLEKKEWIKAIEAAMSEYIAGSSYRKEENSLCEEDRVSIQNRPGNTFCADCNATKPEWASLNLGCLLCINCSGVHRNLGAHVSKVRSMTLDVWRPEYVSVMLACCNQFNRATYEQKVPSRGYKRPIHSSSREEREAWIKAKYERNEFLSDLPESTLTFSERLMEAVHAEEVNYEDLMLLLAHSSPEDINYCHKEKGGRAPLHVACVRGLIAAVQLLLWYSADVNIKDADDRTPLTYARFGNHADVAEVLLHNNCQDNSFETTEQQTTEIPSLTILQASII